jgi:hypothetical protein
MNIWDSLHRGLEKASKEAARIGRIRSLRSTIERLKRECNQQESGLVSRARELYEMGQLHQSELVPFCQALASLQLQLSEAQRELQSLQSGPDAPAQGQTEIITSYPVPEPGTLPAWAPPGSGGQGESTLASQSPYGPVTGGEQATQIAPPPPPPSTGDSSPFASSGHSLSYPAAPVPPPPPATSLPYPPTLPVFPSTPAYQHEGMSTGPSGTAGSSATLLSGSGGNLCPSCQAVLPPGLRYCPRCGQALNVVRDTGSSEDEKVADLAQEPTRASSPSVDLPHLSDQETILQPLPGPQGPGPEGPSEKPAAREDNPHEEPGGS